MSKGKGKGKFKNYQLHLVSFIVGNFIVMGLALRFIDNVAFDYRYLLRVVPFSTFAFIFSYVFNGLLPSELKNKLVFFRWINPLPATRIEKTILSDSRFSLNQLTDKFGEIPTDSREQNIYWYNKIYKPVEDSKKVQDIQKSFLFTRDLTAVSVLLIIVAILYALFLSGNVWFIVIIFIEFLVIRLAAANYGNRFVCTSIAEGISSSSKKRSTKQKSPQ